MTDDGRKYAAIAAVTTPMTRRPENRLGSGMKDISGAPSSPAGAAEDAANASAALPMTNEAED